MKIQLSAHLDTFSLDPSVDRRIAKFAEMGFPAFEFWCWWQEKYKVDEIAASAQNNNIKIAAVCTKFIPLVSQDRHEEYIRALQETIGVCNTLQCNCIISQVGNEIPGQAREHQKQAIIEGLKRAAPMVQASGKMLVIEPLNTLVNHKGYFLWRSEEAVEILESVGSESVKMLYDIYHQQIMEGNILSNIERYMPWIGHFHCAGVPGRHELVGGELDYKTIFKRIADSEYNGYIGLEFFPQGDPIQALEEALSLVHNI